MKIYNLIGGTLSIDPRPDDRRPLPKCGECGAVIAVGDTLPDCPLCGEVVPSAERVIVLGDNDAAMWGER
jgi:hypothetical protein